VPARGRGAAALQRLRLLDPTGLSQQPGAFLERGGELRILRPSAPLDDDDGLAPALDCAIEFARSYAKQDEIPQRLHAIRVMKLRLRPPRPSD
jgi:hypothetical protein